jgi:hypothetical protein
LAASPPSATASTDQMAIGMPSPALNLGFSNLKRDLDYYVVGAGNNRSVESQDLSVSFRSIAEQHGERKKKDEF